MPPDLPLWILAIAVAFAVVFGKETFGGKIYEYLEHRFIDQGLCVLPILVKYQEIVAGFRDTTAWQQVLPEYGWWHTGFFNSIFEPSDGHSLQLPKPWWLMVLVEQPHWLLLIRGHGGYSTTLYHGPDFLGGIPGSIGETNKPFIILGALFLIFTRVASWRIMAGMVLGVGVTGMLFNAQGFNAFMMVPWYYHYVLGSFLFAMAFMATDPVTASGTNKGKWIYGFFIGVVGLVVRVLNPAFTLKAGCWPSYLWIHLHHSSITLLFNPTSKRTSRV